MTSVTAVNTRQAGFISLSVITDQNRKKLHQFNCFFLPWGDSPSIAQIFVKNYYVILKVTQVTERQSSQQSKTKI